MPDARRPPNAAATPVDELVDRLARFEPAGAPVISLYLDARADEHGGDRFESFVRRELPRRVATWPRRSEARAALERDAARVLQWLRDGVRPSANGIAVFACEPAGLFETLQLDAAFPEHRCIVQDRPHVYELARLADQCPRWVGCVVDTNAAHVFVFGHGLPPEQHDVQHAKTRHTGGGGWSQMRYQRHVETLDQQHLREVAGTLDRIVREDGMLRIVLAGEEPVVARLRAELPKATAQQVVDAVRLDIRAPERVAFEAMLAAVRAHDARTDAERVHAMRGEFRAGGLAVVGLGETRRALELGQVDVLVLAARADRIGQDAGGAGVGDELVAQARRTGARVTFVEDASLLEDLEGVGALLRFRMTPSEVRA